MNNITDTEKKILERIIYYTAATSLLIIIFVLICMIIYFALKAMPIKLNESIIGGIIGAFGGIAGGFLTLIGVRYTITLQKRKEFIDAYPKRQLLSDNASDEMLKVIEKIEEIMSNEDLNFESVLTEISEFIKQFLERDFNQVKADAAGVGPEWFEIVKRFELRLKVINSFTYEYFYEGSLDEFDDEMYEWSGSLRDVYYMDFLNVSIKLEEKYQAYMK